ncbi:calcium binding protein CalD [Actinomadura meridiana]|uniref:Calcium binding protein CalD n=1 Tax=Actinomadura meridiana TaxID=559626 RepID=A0ABP8C010_9ACTN
MATTQLAKDRLTTRFDLWDKNGDGLLRREDFQNEGRRVVRAFEESENSPRGHAVISGYDGIWSYISEKAGSVDAVTRAQFERIGDDVIGEGDTGWAAVVRPHITAMAELCDTDGDGRVSQPEFARWLQAIGVKADTTETFRKIDLDGDGHLSVEELSAAIKAYVEGELDTPLLG